MYVQKYVWKGCEYKLIFGQISHAYSTDGHLNAKIDKNWTVLKKKTVKIEIVEIIQYNVQNLQLVDGILPFKLSERIFC